MKEIYFENELKDYLKSLRKELGPISDDKMAKVFGKGCDANCGAICENTCSMWCQPIGSGQTTPKIPDEPVG